MTAMSRLHSGRCCDCTSKEHGWSTRAHLRILSGRSGFHGCLIGRGAVQGQVLVGANPLQEEHCMLAVSPMTVTYFVHAISSRMS